MSMLSRLGPVLAIALVVLFGSKFSAFAADPEQAGFTFITTSDVQIGGPWIVAKSKNFFADEGLGNINLETVSAIPTIYPRFVTGEVAVFASAEPPVLTLAAGGVPLKVVGIYSDQTGLHGVAAGKDVKSAKDLEGRKVALQKGTIMELLFRNFCAAYGCDLAKVDVLSMPAPESATALAQGSVDAIVSWQPFIGRALEAGHGNGVHFLFYNKMSFMPGSEDERRKLHSAWSILTASPDFLKANPNTVQALLRVLKKSIDFIHANPEEAEKIISGALNLPADVTGQYLSAVSYRLLIDTERTAEIQETADYLATSRLIKAPVNFSGDLLDVEALRNVDQAAVDLK